MSVVVQTGQVQTAIDCSPEMTLHLNKLRIITWYSSYFMETEGLYIYEVLQIIHENIDDPYDCPEP